MNTYTKLKNGSFGVKVVGDAFTGKIVSVQTKAGKIKTETIKTVLWTGIDKFSNLGKIALCTILQNTYPSQSQKSPNRDQGWRNNGCSACRSQGGGWCQQCYFDEFDC